MRNLEWLGFSPADLEGDGSDALVDAVVAWGDETAIVARIQEHLAAGADHVCLQPVTSVRPLTDGPDHTALDVLRQPGPALTRRAGPYAGVRHRVVSSSARCCRRRPAG